MSKRKITTVSLGTQVSQFFKSIPQLTRAGMIRPGTPKEWAKIITAVARWDMGFAGLAEMSAASFPKRIALADDEGTITYENLSKYGINIARYLSRHGINGKSSIAVFARNSRGMVLPLMAGTRIGAQAKILNVGSSPEQIRRILREYGADYIFIDGEYVDVIKVADEEGVPVILATGESDGVHPTLMEIAHDDNPEGHLPIYAHQKPTVIMSSGTSGTPKGIVLPVPRTPKVLGGILRGIPYRKNSVVQLTASIFHAWGWGNLHIILATGSTMVLRRYYDAEQAVEDCERYGVDGIISAAVFLRDFLKVANNGEPHPNLGPFRFIVSAGNAIPPELVQDLIRRFGPVLVNFYGSTEHLVISLATSEELAKDPTTAGHASDGVRLAILDENNKEVPRGEIGAIYSSNSMSTRGYLNERDAAKIVDGMLATGDRGYIDKEGRLYICGRADDMVIKGGENVFPREVEEYLLTLDGIADAYVKGVQDDIIARLDAYVVREDSEAGKALTGDILREKVRGHLAAHNVPDRFLWMEELVRNDSGKVVPRYLTEIIEED